MRQALVVAVLLGAGACAGDEPQEQLIGLWRGPSAGPCVTGLGFAADETFEALLVCQVGGTTSSPQLAVEIEAGDFEVDGDQLRTVSRAGSCDRPPIAQREREMAFDLEGDSLRLSMPSGQMRYVRVDTMDGMDDLTASSRYGCFEGPEPAPGGFVARPIEAY